MLEIKVGDILRLKPHYKTQGYALVVDTVPPFSEKSLWFKLEWLDDGSINQYNINEIRSKFDFVS